MVSRIVFFAAALVIGVVPVLKYLGVRGAHAWDMFALTKRVCSYDLYPVGGTPDDRIFITREDFQSHQRLYVLQTRDQFRTAMGVLCRSRDDFRLGAFLGTLRCYEFNEWRTIFRDQRVFCDR